MPSFSFHLAEEVVGSSQAPGVDPRQKRPRHLWLRRTRPRQPWAQGRSACVRSRTKLFIVSAAGLVGLAAAAPLVANAATQAPAPARQFNVASFGALAQGADARPALQQAIDAASQAG